MVQKSLELGDGSSITLESIGGSLHVKGWKRNTALIKTSSEQNVQFEQSGDALTIRCPEDCILYVPHDAHLHVQHVGREARFKAVEGKLKIDLVGGSLALRDVGSTEAKTVSGGLSAKRVRGDLIVNQIGGSASIRDIDGQFSAEGVGGNLRLRDVSGGIAANVGGNARLDIAPVPWQAYAVTAGGNIRCQISADVNAEISFTSGAQIMRLKLPDQTHTIREVDYQYELGEGGTPIQLNAGGKIDFVGTGSDWDFDDDFEFDIDADFSSMAEELTRQATEQVEVHLSTLQSHLAGLSTTLQEAGLSEERTREIQERLEQARERATTRAQEAAQRAQQKLERKLAAAQRKAAREARRSGRKAMSIDLDAVRAARHTSAEIVSDEERMMILQMLQENAISVEQAEELLAALDGK